MNDDERKALAEACGRVANLRAMFNKGGVQNSEPPAWKRRQPVKVPTGDRSPDEDSNESGTKDALRRVQKGEEETKKSHAAVRSSKTLVDAAIQERKLREEQERRSAQEVRQAMVNNSPYDLESDRAYNHSVKQREYERLAEQKAKESLAQYTSNGRTFEAEKREQQRRLEEVERKKEEETKHFHATTTYSAEYDHSYNHYHKQRKTVTKAEQEAQKTLGHYAGGKTYFEEQLDEKKRLQQLDRQNEQHAKDAKSNFSSPAFDHVYVHAKELAQVEKEAEEKAKAVLSKYDQRDASHEYLMKNGIMVLKRADSTGTPEAKRYPFTDPAARIKKPSPQTMKALARFQAQLAETRAREGQKAGQKAFDATSHKASWESTRKMSMESLESMESVRKKSLGEVDIEQVNAFVDEAKLDVRSAAQKFAEMDRKAAELAKQNKKPLTFNGISYGHSGQVFRTNEKERKETKHKNEMATRIQSRVRGVIARGAYSDKVSAAEKIAIRIQTAFQRRQAQKQAKDLRQRLQHEQSCAVAIQKIVRGRFEWNRYQTVVAARKAAVVLLQSLVRSRQAQAAYTKQIKAVHEIQEFATRMMAGRYARNEIACLRKKSAAATVIQSMFRTRAAFSQAKARLDAVIRLQCALRQSRARRDLSRLKYEATINHVAKQEIAHSLATKLQSLWRGSVARSDVSALRAQVAEIAAAEAAAAEEAARQAEVESSMATKIQSHWRGSVARSDVSKMQPNLIDDVETQLSKNENRMAIRIQRRWRDVVAHFRVAAVGADVAEQHEAMMAVRLQGQWRSVIASRDVNEIREQRQALSKAQSEHKNVMALKIQCWWRTIVAVNEVVKSRQSVYQAKREVKNALIIQAAWRVHTGRKEAAPWQSESNSRQKESSIENPQIHQQPTLAELQFLSQKGRFSYLSDDSDGDSEFEDAPSFVGDAPFAPASTQSLEFLENERISSSRLSHGAFDPRVSTSSVDKTLEFSIPEYHSAYNDDKSDASSDIFVDAMEEHKPIEHNFHNASDDENRHWTEESNNSAFDFASFTDTSVSASGAAPPSPIKEESSEEAESEPINSSISDFDRPSSVRSGSFIQEPSLDLGTPRGSLASSSLCGESRPRDESLADPFRSHEDSYADSTQSRRDSYADSTQSRNDSYAAVFRSRDNSYDDEFRPRVDSYDDVPFKSDYDEQSLVGVESREGLKYFNSESDRESSFISDSPAPGQNISEIEKIEVHEEEQATHKKNGSRWRGVSVLSALSSRRSSKPTSSPSSSFEDEEKDEMKGSSSTLPSVASLGSVANLLTRKLSVPTSNSSSTKSFEAEIEESVVYSPETQQAPKSKSRFGRFTTPTVSKSAFPTRFAWKS